MKNLLRFEEAALFALCVLMTARLEMGLSWWVYILIFLSPDIGMAGYLVSTQVGAVTYNFLHHKALGATLIAFGLWQGGDAYLFAGLIQIAHSAFDRMLGYGLKYPDSFKHTSIGDI